MRGKGKRKGGGEEEEGEEEGGGDGEEGGGRRGSNASELGWKGEFGKYEEGESPEQSCREGRKGAFEKILVVGV